MLRALALAALVSVIPRAVVARPLGVRAVCNST
jgi:hypothetical protein